MTSPIIAHRIKINIDSNFNFPAMG